eukprot:TRINITY_DN11217_c0_g1_i1.p3 TRINITY_DN11217_c0_g1~~TRINITY_DN11217_c0_g1_i1.p3  ORF type:complete len:154 (-),score=26.39 TRINITY_DN11217_c0_g1_i1:497-958(-)
MCIRDRSTWATADGKILATGIDMNNSSFYDNATTVGDSFNINNSVDTVNVKNKWVKIGLQWKYFDNNGNILRNKWFKDPSTQKWYYFQINGYMTTGWRFIDGDWYYFDKSGEMKTGWVKDINEKWYYLTSSGPMARSTTVDGYKLNARGEFVN